ncbi:CYTH1 [Cordylochernes scorpioides]|uniref:CYTH1 n=1 Tax=Cordylochernes scorpioides TaxID=51811 RepID=A0ABY6LDA9_9ARAC|nr:CYTH1 [Cordylochernes scorpioides]
MSNTSAEDGSEELRLADIRRRKAELHRKVQQLTEKMGAQAGSRTNIEAKQLSIGKNKFNSDPKKGIEYLIENNLLNHTAEDIALFLYKGKGLSKTAIGDYLGERKDFNISVLNAFSELHNLTDMTLVQALRQFLGGFRLPGEAQKIDRIMEIFSQCYCRLNPGTFCNNDTCYVLSFAIIMLNTSLHNPGVKERLSIDKFIAMNRGINEGGDLPQELLVSLYTSIKQEPFKLPEEDAIDLLYNFFNPDKEGWLWKQGGRYKSWKRRWFILKDNCLYYFKCVKDNKPQGIIPLENIQVRDVQDRKMPHCFEIYSTGSEMIKACKTDYNGKVVKGNHNMYRMSAASQQKKDEWIDSIGQSVTHNPFYDILAARKNKKEEEDQSTDAFFRLPFHPITHSYIIRRASSGQNHTSIKLLRLPHPIPNHRLRLLGPPCRPGPSGRTSSYQLPASVGFYDLVAEIRSLAPADAESGGGYIKRTIHFLRRKLEDDTARSDYTSLSDLRRSLRAGNAALSSAESIAEFLAEVALGVRQVDQLFIADIYRDQISDFFAEVLWQVFEADCHLSELVPDCQTYAETVILLEHCASSSTFPFEEFRVPLGWLSTLARAAGSDLVLGNTRRILLWCLLDVRVAIYPGLHDHRREHRRPPGLTPDGAAGARNREDSRKFSRERDAKDTNDVEIWALIGLDDGTGFEISQPVISSDKSSSKDQLEDNTYVGQPIANGHVTSSYQLERRKVLVLNREPRLGSLRLDPNEVPRYHRLPRPKSRQDRGRQGTSKQIDHCLYRKIEQGREEDSKEPMKTDTDYESGENTTFPKLENTLGRTQEIAPSQEDVTPPPPVSDVLGRLTTTLHQLSAVTGNRERWNRYDGSYEAQSFFTNYDAQADRAQLQYSTRLRKPANLLQAPLRVTNTRAYVTCSPDHL